MGSKFPQLSLGTAQFGMDYGVTNISGKIDKIKIKEILKEATKLGITFLDTAQVYGNSEYLIGKNLAPQNNFKIISKITIDKKLIESNFNHEYLEELVFLSLKNLNIQKLDSLLVHNINDQNNLNIETIFSVMKKLKEKNLINRIGASIYKPNELKKLPLKYLDIVQLPLSIYNQEFIFKGSINTLKSFNISIHVRSIFLQGLILTPSVKWPKNISYELRKHHKYYENFFQINNISMLEAALYFHYRNKEIESVIFGITNINELNEIVNAWDNLYKKENILKNVDFASINWNKEKDLDPRKW